MFLKLLRLKENYKIDGYGEFDDKDAEDRFKDMLESGDILKELREDFGRINLASENDYTDIKYTNSLGIR